VLFARQWSGDVWLLAHSSFGRWPQRQRARGNEHVPGRQRPKPGVEAAELVSRGEEVCPPQHLHERMGKEGYNNQVNNGGDTECEGEPSHVTHRQNKQHRRGEEAHGVGG